MSWTLQDKLYTGTGSPVVGYTVVATPGYTPLFELQSDALLHQTAAPYPSAITDGTGQYSMTLPLQSEQSPTTSKLIIGPMHDNTYWAGLPPTSAGTYSMTQLINSWGWGATNVSASTTVVTGPAAVIGTKAGIPSDADYTTLPTVGSMVIDTTDNRLYVRMGAASWKYAALT